MPRWHAGRGIGGPLAQHWCPEAANATYAEVPAAIVWHFEKPELVERDSQRTSDRSEHRRQAHLSHRTQRLARDV